MTILLDLVRAVERLLSSPPMPVGTGFRAIRVDEAAHLLSLAAAARTLLDKETIAELLWQTESRRARGRDRNIPWSELAPDQADIWRDYADAVLLSGLI